MKKELAKEKFDGLNDINKIRHTLGVLRQNQMRLLLIVALIGFLIISILLFLPFIILYGRVSQIFLMAVLGILIMVFDGLLIFFGLYVLTKMEEGLDKFLIKNSKK